MDTMAIATQPQQQQGIPFRKGTRQHFRLTGNIPYVTNREGIPQQLDQVGFLAGLLIHVTGVMTLVAASALTADGPWNLIRRIRLVLNTGVNILDLSGYGAFEVNHLIKEEFNPASSALAAVFAAPTLIGANQWDFLLWLPIASNDGINFEAGLINLQTEELRARVEIVWAPETDATGGTPTFVGRADVHSLFYEVPDPRVVQFPPLNVLHRLVEDRINIVGTGDVRYPILRQGTMQQLIHTVRLNGARDTVDVTALRLELNRSDQVYRYLRQAQLWHHAMRYGQDLPAGVFVWDWWNAQLDVSQGDARDMIDTEAIAQTDSVIEIAAAAVLGANNNFLDTIRRFTQILTP